MKKTLILLLIINFSTACNHNTSKSLNNNTSNIQIPKDTIMQGTDLELMFILSRRETSKDVNSGSVTIEISDNKITITKTYGGFKAPDDEFQENEMTAEMQQQIMDFIKENSLDTNLTESRSTDKLGIAGEFSFEIKSPTESKINTNGKTNI
jgi:hypothetical protein